MPSLVAFSIDDNKLLSWNQQIILPQSLEHFFVSGKNIQQISNSLQNCKKLQELKITNTSITKIPEWIGSLQQLYWLELDDNLITELPNSIGQLKACRILQLRNNCLDTIPESVLLLPGLVGLALNGNPLRHIPKTLLLSKSLSWINISNTKISNEEYKVYRRQVPATVDIGHDKIIYFEDEVNPCYTGTQSNKMDKIFRRLQNDPYFLGGENKWQSFLKEYFNLTTTNAASDETDFEMTDTVSLKFVVRREGGLSDITVVAYNNEAAKEEAIRLLKLSCAYWVPSHIGGRNVNAWYQQSFIFSVSRYGGHVKSSIKAFNPLPANIRVLNPEED